MNKKSKSSSRKNAKINSHKPEKATERDLTLKQRLWSEFYLQHGNATEAARQAGYQGSDNTLAQIGRENLRDHRIKVRIEDRIAEAGVTTDEVIGTLAAQMRANILDAFEDSDSPQVKRLRENNLGHLIRKVKIRRYTEKRGLK